MEIVEYVVTSLRRPSILHSLLAVLIVELPLFWIKQCIISFFELLKFVWISSFIRMFLECTFAKGFLDLFGSGILGDLKQFIVGGGVDLLLTVSLRGFLLLFLSFVLPFVVLVACVEEHTTKESMIYIWLV